jgi:hypothetical protein
LYGRVAVEAGGFLPARADALARAGGVERLQDALLRGGEDASRSALYGLMAAGDAAVPGLLAALAADKVKLS